MNIVEALLICVYVSLIDVCAGQPYSQHPVPAYPQPRNSPSGDYNQQPAPLPQPPPNYAQRLPPVPPQPTYGQHPLPLPEPQPSYPGPPQVYPPPSQPGNYNPQRRLPQSQQHSYGVRQGGTFGNTGRRSLPDTSDPCYRKYANCIIVNAQPYERRSTISVEECKRLCLSQTAGTYVCRSFVYDNQNQVCDLFAHSGNQYPARLVQYFGRDYYEPTGQSNCAAAPVPATSLPPTLPPPVPTPSGSGSNPCNVGEEARYLRIQGFELADNDHNNLGNIALNQCIDRCNSDRACNSFDYTNGQCITSSEAAVPTGNGQLVQNPNAEYYEQICVESGLVQNCPDVFERVPQMILVGFAETVVDATSFEECLDNCINAPALYGFSCRSGMYYFEEPQLNCILNTENKDTQPDLFTEENNDIVDYFETGCTSNKALVNRLKTRGRFKARGGKILAVVAQVDSERVNTLIAPSVGVISEKQPAFGQWTQWSPCDRTKDGRRVRYKRCRKPNLKNCPAETEWCNRESKPRNILNLDSSALFGVGESHTNSSDLLSEEETGDNSQFPCGTDVCCPVFGGCRIGLELSSLDQKTHWCTNPCKNRHRT